MFGLSAQWNPFFPFGSYQTFEPKTHVLSFSDERICRKSMLVLVTFSTKSCVFDVSWRRPGLRTIIHSSANVHRCAILPAFRETSLMAVASKRLWLDRSFGPSSASSLRNKFDDASKNPSKYKINTESRYKWELCYSWKTPSAWTRQQFNVQCPAEISAFVLVECVPAARDSASRNLHTIWALRIF